MKKISIKSLWVLICFISFNSFSQTANNCLSVREGFIVKIIENIKGDEQLTKSIDYLFFNEKPKIEKSDTPISLYQKNGQLINIAAYRSANFKRSMTEEYVEFDKTKSDVSDFIKNKSFNFQVYRVSMAFSIQNAEINSITNNETSHSYSYFKNLPENKLMEEIEIIYPLLIEVW